MHERITIEPIGEPLRLVPSVDVVIVNSRGADNPWFHEALACARGQCHPNTNLLVVDNNDHGLSIGAAWNMAARVSSAKYIFPFGDDDRMAMDTVSHLVQHIEKVRGTTAGEEVVMASSGLTAIDENGRFLCLMHQSVLGADHHHSGMWLREFIVKEPFDETATKEVAVRMRERLDMRTSLDRKLRYYCTGHHFGYQYRQHVGMVSGQKVAKQRPSTNILHQAR